MSDSYNPGPLRMAFVRGIMAANNDPVEWTREQAMDAAKHAYPDVPTPANLVRSDHSSADATDVLRDVLDHLPEWTLPTDLLLRANEVLRAAQRRGSAAE